MKKGIFFKATCALMATVLVGVSVLVYVDKKAAKASNNVAKETNTIDNQVENAMESFDEVSVKGNSTIYKMKVQGDKVTYNVTETATGRKILQTSENSNEYTEVVLDNGKMTVTAGEVVNGKYIAKNSDSSNIEEEAQKIKQENTENSNRVSCMALGKSLWYEKDDANVNIGKSRFGKDLEKKAIDLNSLNKDDSKNVDSYQKYVDNASKNWIKTKENLKKISKQIGDGIIFGVFEATLLLVVAVTSIISGLACTTLLIIAAFITLLMLPKIIPAVITGSVATIKVITNSVKGLNNGIKAQKAYNKIENLGKAY